MANERFVRKLFEQLTFLDSSCKSYDAGTDAEMFRIAQSLRILFHNNPPRSTSLASHCGVTTWEFLSSPPTTSESIKEMRFISIQLDLSAETPMVCKPRLGQNFNLVPFDQWWNAETVFRFEGKEFMRRHLILSAANKEGGAHVDAVPDRFYEELESGLKNFGVNRKNLQFNGEPPFDKSIAETEYAMNPQGAMIRQFAHEILTTVNHMKWTTKLHFSNNTQPYWRNLKR